jgi:hypothetical protein
VQVDAHFLQLDAVESGGVDLDESRLFEKLGHPGERPIERPAMLDAEVLQAPQRHAHVGKVARHRRRRSDHDDHIAIRESGQQNAAQRRRRQADEGKTIAEQR